jgi:hypothetical protein
VVAAIVSLVYFAELRGASASSVRCCGGVGRAIDPRDHDACLSPGGRCCVLALSSQVRSCAWSVPAAHVRRSGQRHPGGHRAAGTSVPLPQRCLPDGDVRRTGHRVDQPTRPLHPADARDPDLDRPRTGRASGQPARPRAGDTSGEGHPVTPAQSLPGGARRAGQGTRRRRFRLAEG